MNQFAPVIKAAQSMLFKSALYVGEGEVITVCKQGESAPADEVIHLYRDILYMDEESLLYRLNGGASYCDIQAFADVLADDGALVERVLPFERCIVPMKASRRVEASRLMRDGLVSDYGEALHVAQRNRESWLLIRDGDNINIVQSSLVFLDHLFADEVAFKALTKAYQQDGVGDAILRDTLDYDKLHDSIKDLISTYHSLALLLQGLHDRETGVLGKFDKRPSFIWMQRHQVST